MQHVRKTEEAAQRVVRRIVSSNPGLRGVLTPEAVVAICDVVNGRVTRALFDAASREASVEDVPRAVLRVGDEGPVVRIPVACDSAMGEYLSDGDLDEGVLTLTVAEVALDARRFGRMDEWGACLVWGLVAPLVADEPDLMQGLVVADERDGISMSVRWTPSQ